MKTMKTMKSRFQNLVAAEVTRLKHSEDQSLLTSAATVLKEPLKITLNDVRRWQSEGSVSKVTGAIMAGLVWLGVVIGLHAQPVIPSTQPSNQVACLGGCLTYSVEATGTPPLNYQWRIYTTTGYSVVPGETASTIVLCNVPTNNTRLRVVVTDGGGLSSTSRLALMTIVLPPSITQQPRGAWAVIGESFIQSVIANGTTPRYQWYFNGQPLDGKTANSLVISSVQLTNEGVYHVVISNVCGVVTSDTARLTVVPNTTFAQITSGPLVQDLGDSPYASIADYDGDGRLDVFANRHVNGLSTLYRNLGGGNFARVTNDFSPMSWGYPSSEWADLDNDGRLDVLVVDVTGSLPNFFALNNGDGSFTKTLIEKVTAWSISMMDYDQDGFLDLHLIGGSRWTNSLYRSLGGQSFQSVTSAEVGGDLLTAPPVNQFASWADFDDDGRQDLFVASFTNYPGFTVTNYMPCQMYRNEGRGRFVTATNQVTQDAIHGWMGAWGDYDNDGRADLLYCATRWTASSAWDSFLYRNLGGGRFERSFVGFTLPWADVAAWGDYDNDGFLDLLMTERPGRGCSLFRNNGNGTFTRITAGPVVSNSPSGTYSVTPCWFDYDNDGFLDLFVANGDDRGAAMVANYLYHNQGNSNAWLKVKLVGAASNRDAVGAKVWVTADFARASRRQRREIAPGQFLGGNNRIAHFGLGDATNVATLRVEWPSGQVTELNNVAVRQHLTIMEAPGVRVMNSAQGAMQIELTAHVGMNIELRATNNLPIDFKTVPFTNWPLWKTVLQTNRTTTVTDPEASQYPWRFFGGRAQ